MDAPSRKARSRSTFEVKGPARCAPDGPVSTTRKGWFPKVNPTDSSERWLPVVGFEGFYEVSNLGRVRSIDRIIQYSNGHVRSARGRDLHAYKMGEKDHLFVTLRGRKKAVHRLVLSAFVGPCPDGMECCHDDGDPTNNAVSNLYWGTRSQNMRDRFRHGWVGAGPLARIARNGTNRCPNGHEMVPDNCRKVAKEGHFPRCKQCHVQEQRVYREKKRFERAGMQVSA